MKRPGSPGLSLVPPGLGEFYASEIEDYAFDIAAANALLDERVKQRTRELTSANQRLQAQWARLRRANATVPRSSPMRFFEAEPQGKVE